MPDYRSLEPEELALDPSFQRWRLHNDPTASAFWNEWMLQNPDRREQVEKARFLLTTISNQFEQQMTHRVRLSDAEIQQEISQLYQSLDRPKPEPVRWFQFSPIRYGAAASVLVLLGLFGWYLLRPAASRSELTYQELVGRVMTPLAEVHNTTAKPLLVNLPDRSTILLFAGSRISYDKQFAGTRREIYLSGEAFFEVAKNPARPFYVYANSLVTKVLGTSFTVQADEQTQQVKVVVKTGKVSVYTQDQTPAADRREDFKLNGTVLTPNQQVVFSTKDTRMVRSLVSEPTLLGNSVQKQSFAFKRTPIAEVFAALEKAYNITIIFDAETMKDCYLTASLADEPLFDKLDLICHTINAHYNLLETSIVIDSKGCK